MVCFCICNPTNYDYWSHSLAQMKKKCSSALNVYKTVISAPVKQSLKVAVNCQKKFSSQNFHLETSINFLINKYNFDLILPCFNSSFGVHIHFFQSQKYIKILKNFEESRYNLKSL